MQNWFERLFGFRESNRATVLSELAIEGSKLRSRRAAGEWNCGRLEVVSLAELRGRQIEVVSNGAAHIKVSEVVGDAQALHANPVNCGALFQVASQFNLLEMMSPAVTPDQGIAIYERDPTQGPACAIACGAGTLYRNYFVELDGELGQTANRQVDCLSAIGEALGNRDGRLWQIRNGYALPTAQGLSEIDHQLRAMSASELDELRGQLQIGLQWDTQVTLAGCSHLVTQAYCYALPVAYSGLPERSWERFAKLILEAAYEATLAAAVCNAAQTGNKGFYLTLLGGGAFGNAEEWILDAIHRAINLYRPCDLDVKIVSFRRSNPAVRERCETIGLAG